MTAWVDPVFFRIGSLEVRWYGLLLAAAVLASTAALARLLARLGASRPWDEASQLAARLVPAGLLGARLAFVVQNLPFYWSSPHRVVAFWDGGLSIHGALLGGLAALAFHQRRPGRFLARVDLLLTVLPLGQSIGRWGNLFNRELLGEPTGLPWGLYVEPAYRPPGLAAATTFHPVFLYESLADLVLFAWLWRRAARAVPGQGPRPAAREPLPVPALPSPGTQTALYMMGYGAVRFALELVRIGPPALLGLTLAQWASLALGAVGYAVYRRRSPEPLA